MLWNCKIFIFALGAALILSHNARGDYHNALGLILNKFISNYALTVNGIVFACNKNNLLQISRETLKGANFIEIININDNYIPNTVFTRASYRKTLITSDCTCVNTKNLLLQASVGRFLNKTYQWFLWSVENQNAELFIPSGMKYLGPNSQLTFINGTKSTIKIWSVYSNGMHLKSPLKTLLIGSVRRNESAQENIGKYILDAQLTRKRNQFHGLTLRGVTVIDYDNVTSNGEITVLLSERAKHSGISAFTKYYFELTNILKEHINFSIEFRIARGWAGRLDNTTFRLGFLGIMARNEADIGASGIFNRKNRFADFDIIHQGWKFETAFVYKFVPELRTKIERASFFVPFQKSVWIVIIWLITVLSLIYWLMDNITIRLKNKTPFIARGYIYKQRTRYQNKIYEYGRKYDDFIPEEQISLTNIALFPIAATCQQNFSSESKLGAVKITFLVMFLYSLLLYNYYTSSVVSGLLSSTAQGPSSVEEIISSSLEVSFEDIGYYKILFRENKSPIIIRFIATKLLPPRKENDLPIYTNIKNAVHFIKRGSHAFHCELVDAFPEIAKNFDANDICALRIVKGLMDSELMNGILHKNSQYTEIFRYTLSWSRESGLIGRILYNRLQRKPPCQAVYIVFPVNFSNITSICILLVGGILLSLLTSFAELYIYRYYFVRKYSMN